MSDVRPGTGRDPLLGSLLGGRYRLLDVVGSGGAGRVYRAIQEPMGREVAVKVLHPHLDEEGGHDFQARFLREAALAGRLQHPHVVTVHDYGRSPDGACYIVMEHLRGRTLRSILRDGALPIDRSLRVFGQLVRGLRAAHREGMVHRDVKPSNVILLVDEDGRDWVKLFDFGLVKGDDDSQVTVHGAFMGTPQYVSPEQARGEEADGRSDLYSAGVILYRMLTGVLPYNAESPVAVALKHARDPYPPMAERMPGIAIPPVVEELVRDLMAKDADERPPDADAVLRRLSLVRASLGFDDEQTLRGRLPEDAPSISALRSVGVVGPDALEEVPPASDTGLAADEVTVTVAPHRRRTGPLAVAAIGLALGGTVGLGAAVVGGGGGEEEDATVALSEAPSTGEGTASEGAGHEATEDEGSTEQPPPPPREVTVLVSSEPGGAQVWQEDVLLGLTPMVQRLVVDPEDLAPERTLTLRAEGHREASLTLDLSEDEATGHVVLAPVARAAAPAPSPSASAASEPATSEPAASQPAASQPAAAPTARAVFVDGVAFTAEEAAAALALVNEGDADAVRAAGVAPRQANIILDRRPFADLSAVAATPYIGPKTMEALQRAAAR